MVGNISRKELRVEYIDLFRAFGIILMIMGHIKFGAVFSKWIHAFHMPMFFFISGWFFKPKNNVRVSRQICDKAKSLLIPYLCFEIIVWIVCLLYFHEYRSWDTLKYILFENTYAIPVKYSANGISPIPGAMWFLTSLFICEEVYIFLDRILGHSWKLHFAVSIVAVFGMVATNILPFRLPWAMDASFVGVGLFHIARITKGNMTKRIFNLKWWCSILIGIAISGLIMLNHRINMRLGNYDWYPLFWINALGAIVVGFNLSRYLEYILNKNLLSSRISHCLKGIGKNSVIYLCLNQIVIIFVTQLFELIGLRGLVAKIPILLLTVIILYGFEKLICNTQLKVLIGKKVYKGKHIEDCNSRY